MEINDKSKRELVIKFVNHFMDEDVEGLYKDPIVEYDQFITKEKETALTEISKEYSVDYDKLKQLVDDYSFYQDDAELRKEVTSLYSNSDLDIMERIDKITKLPGSIKGSFDKFNEITIY